MDPELNITPELSPTPRRHVWLVAIGLAAVTLAIYGQTLQFQFVSWDDPDYIYENSHIAQGVTMASVKWAFSSGYAGNWHPLTWISHMVDVELFGLERGGDGNLLQGPGGHHLVSVLLHLANSLLLLCLLTRMTGAFWPSALVAALFAFHPLRVESVAWLSERKDVLSGLFFMLTLLAYHGYTRRPTLRRYLLVFIALALGLMSKPMLVTVPFLLLLLDLWPLRRWELPGWPARQLVLEKLPLLGLAIASGMVTLSVQKAAGAVAALDRIPWAWRLVNTPVATIMYLIKSVWPTRLAFFYPHPVDIPGKQIGDLVLYAVATALFLALVTFAVIFTARRRPYLLVGWLWFLGMLIPVIGLMQVGSQAWADRYAYLPLVGVTIMLSGWLGRLAHDCPAARRGVITVTIVVILALVPLTWRQVAVWRDSRSLYEHALAVTENNYRVHNNWGIELAEQGRSKEAMDHYRQALEIRPDIAETHINMGIELQASGRARGALQHFREALRINSNSVRAHSNWGKALHSLGQMEEAVAHYQQALAVQPDYAMAHFNWGVALAASGRFEEAVEHYRKAVEINPKLAVAYHNLGVLYAGAGRLEQAIEQFELALRAQPGFTRSQQSLRRARAELGGMEDGGE